MTDFLHTLRQANLVRQGEWDSNNEIDGPLGLLFRSNELGGEVGEVQNEVKKLVREQLGIKGGKQNVEDLKDEIGDVLISLDLLAMDYGISLADAARTKFNKTSEKHDLTTRIL